MRATEGEEEDVCVKAEGETGPCVCRCKAVCGVGGGRQLLPALLLN